MTRVLLQYRLTLLSILCLGVCIAQAVHSQGIAAGLPAAPAVASLSCPPLLCQALQPLTPDYQPTFRLVACTRDTAPPLPAPLRPRPAVPARAGRDWRVPRSLVKGILYVETRSLLRPDDSVAYIDRRIGRLGERGPSQMRRMAFDQVARPGERFDRLQRDMGFALEMTERYLLWLRQQTRSWSEAVAAWNAGIEDPSGGEDYYGKVARAASRLAMARRPGSQRCLGLALPWPGPDALVPR